MDPHRDFQFQDEILTSQSIRNLVTLLEGVCERMSVATGTIALHVLAQEGATMSLDDKRKLTNEPWFGKLLMRLGGQLAGASESDAVGLTTILWAMAQLDAPGDSQLIEGLIKRLFLLAQHGRVPPPQLCQTAQALARLKLLSGPIGNALTNIAGHRLSEMHAAQLGTIARCLAEGLGPKSEPFLSAILSTRLGEFSTGGVAVRLTTESLGGGRFAMDDVQKARDACLVHGAASMLVAIASSGVPPSGGVAALDILISALDTGRFNEMDVPLSRLAELHYATQAVGAQLPSAKEVAERCSQTLKYRLAHLSPLELPAAVSELEALGKLGASALKYARERQASLQEQITSELSNARDENQLLALLQSRPVNGMQLTQGLTQLSTMIQRCPDPPAWAASLISRPEFGAIMGKLKEMLPKLDSGYMVEALCAMADLKVKDPLLLTVFFENLSGRLHAFSAPDAAKCLWAFCALGLAQAPAYPRMMRTIDKQLHTLPAQQISRMICAIVPLGRAAACARLLPRLVTALSGANPRLEFAELLSTSRLLCRRLPLAEPLLMQLFQMIKHELESEGEGSLAGNLTPDQIATSIWLFVRHYPLVQQQSPMSPLLQMLPPCVEQLLALMADLDSLPAENLCDLINVVARLQQPNTPLLSKIIGTFETRLTRNQLRLPQIAETAWALFELNGSLQGESPTFMERLMKEVEKRASSEGIDQVKDTLQLLSSLPFRRPWPILDPLALTLRNVDLEKPQELTEVMDALSRMRYDDVKLLDAIEIQVERSLGQQRLHEAQACTMLEAFGTLGYHGRTGSLISKLLDRIGQASSLMPHSGVSLTHGLALLRTEPQEPLSLVKIPDLIAASGLPLELADVAILLWSFVELGCAEAAIKIIQSLPQDMAEQCVTADITTLTLTLWSLLALRAYDVPLLGPLLHSVAALASGVQKPSQLCRLAECMLMMQLEKPAELNLQLPPDLCMRAQMAWQQSYTAIQQSEAPSQQLTEISQALDGLQLPHRVKVFNTYPIGKTQHTTSPPPSRALPPPLLTPTFPSSHPPSPPPSHQMLSSPTRPPAAPPLLSSPTRRHTSRRPETRRSAGSSSRRGSSRRSAALWCTYGTMSGICCGRGRTGRGR